MVPWLHWMGVMGCCNGAMVTMGGCHGCYGWVSRVVTMIAMVTMGGCHGVTVAMDASHGGLIKFRDEICLRMH